jgi:hypothetical protein
MISTNKEIGMKPQSPKPSVSVSPQAEPQLKCLDSAAFNAAAFTREWLIQGILVRGEPAVIGGPKKTFKTSLAVDMAISLGSGRPFLGKFRVPARRTVAVFSGESGAATMQDMARRICAAKHVRLDDCTVHWCFDLPRLGHEGHRGKLGEILCDNKVQVVFIDLLYMCLLAGSKSVSPSNLYEIGPLLWAAARTCLDAGATPVFVHHATKSAAKQTSNETPRPLSLDDLTYVGVGEFVRQWLLVNRLGPFSMSNGRHELVVAAGGSAGHSGEWTVTIDEGRLDANMAGRGWAVSVCEGVRTSEDLDDATWYDSRRRAGRSSSSANVL